MGDAGKYIVIEGNDGTGKSTQVAKLAEYFRSIGRTVCVIEEPGSDDPEKSTPIANELRRVIKNGDLARSAAVNVALFSARLGVNCGEKKFNLRWSVGKLS